MALPRLDIDGIDEQARLGVLGRLNLEGRVDIDTDHLRALVLVDEDPAGLIVDKGVGSQMTLASSLVISDIGGPAEVIKGVLNDAGQAGHGVPPSR